MRKPPKIPYSLSRTPLGLFISHFKPVSGSFSRFARVIGFFLVFYVLAMFCMVLLTSLAGMASIVMSVAFIPVAMFLAYRFAHATNRTIEGKKNNES
jgi:hypothetical protein